MFKVITKALIIKEGKILLLKRSNNSNFARGLWDLPGGKLIYKESLIESLKREVFEETKLSVDIIKPISTSSGIDIENNKQYITIVYLCKHLEGDINLNSEHNEYIWIDVNKIDVKNTIYYALEALQKI